MAFKKSQMLFGNEAYYQWQANDEDDDPYYTNGIEYSELNKREGYEVLYFIYHLGMKYWEEPTLQICQKIEWMLRYEVPKNIKTHKRIDEWIISNWSRKFPVKVETSIYGNVVKNSW